METQNITCINCPMGCRMTVTLENHQVTVVEGNGCKRGETYARQECVAPMRVITAAAPLQNRDVPVSVKTASPVPKDKIAACMQAILAGVFCAHVHIGDVLLPNVCGTGADVVATRDVP